MVRWALGMRRGAQDVGSLACCVSVEALGEGLSPRRVGQRGCGVRWGRLWFEALGMWSVVFSWGVWCVSLGDRRVGLAALGLRVWC